MQNILKTLNVLCLLMTILSYNTGILNAQIDRPRSSELTVTYEVIERELYRQDPNVKLSNYEKAQMLPRLERKKMEKQVNNKNEVWTLIESLENNRKEDWMNDNSFIVITPNDVSYYNKDKRLIGTSPHSQKYLEIAANRTGNLYPKIDFSFTQREIDGFRRQGVKVIRTGGNYLMSYGQTELFYNVVEKVVIKKDFDRTGNLTKVETTEYMDYGTNFTVPIRKTERTFANIGLDNCAEKVRIKDYKNFKIVDRRKSNKTSIASESNLGAEVSIQPNPTTDKLFVNLPYLPKEEKLTLTMVDLNGTVVLEDSAQPQTTKLLSLSKLPIGVYFLRVSGGEYYEVLKVVKR